MTRDAIGHDEARALLPWLVNGTLEADERERVERHARECLPCRAELKEQRALAELIRRHPDLPSPAERDFERLSRRIDGREEGVSAAQPGAGGPWFFARARRVALLAAAACVALGGLAALVGLPGQRPGPDRAFATLSDAAGNRALIDVIFAEGTTEEQMRELIADLDATIVAGPSRVGRYTLRLPDSRAQGSDVDTLVRVLLRDPRVRFAGRTYAPPTDGRSPRP